MSSKFLILIPTYNEKKNIKPILKKINKHFKYKYDILFIDDNSIDGTKKIINNIKLKNVSIINRKSKLGVGSAHKEGIKFGYKKKYKYIITMDCDGTHKPDYLNKIVKLSKSCDLVITNRFISKNSLLGWSFYRKFVTSFRYLLVKLMFNTNLDTSGAFRCYNTNKIRLKDIILADSNSYSFFTESTLILFKKNYKISQLSVILPKRYSGSSKMKFLDLITGFLYTLLIFFKLKII
tara:strand:- start:430 stop:1137 length:708 start_codon:yes stop_codon:yes gene_type:complete